MNKILTAVVLTSSLLLLDIPDAAAHGNKYDKRYRSDTHYSRHYQRDYHSYRGHRRNYYGAKYKRSKHMPYWLERDRHFRRWYRHSHFRWDRRISWNRLFDIYYYELHVHRRHRH